MTIKNDTELCKWLRDHSSGIYRPSAQAAARIEELSALASQLLKHIEDLVETAEGALELLDQTQKLEALEEQTLKR